MIKQTIFAFLIFLSISSQSQDKPPANPDRPPVIAVGGFANNFGHFGEFAHCIMATRDRVVSELVSNYDCIVLSRAKGYDLAVEKGISEISGTEKPASVPEPIPAADYAITGYIEGGKIRSPDNIYLISIDFVLVTTKLAENSKMDFKTCRITGFDMETADQYSSIIAERIAKELNLRKKKDMEIQETKKTDEVWAVLPFSRLESQKMLRTPPDRDIAISVELALQESDRLKAIVDHKDIDRTLAELKITTLSGATEGLAGALARIVGADKIIMGTVSDSYDIADNLRVDILLVDGKTSVILDSRTVTCDSKTMDKKVSEAAVTFFKYKHRIAPLKESTRELRHKEAGLYLDVEKSIRAITYGHEDEIEEMLTALSLLDSAYCLAEGSDEIMYGIASRMVNIAGTGNFREKFPDTVDGIARRVENMLKDMPPSARCPSPQFQLASAKIATGRYDEALKIAARLAEKHPNLDKLDLSSAPGPSNWDSLIARDVLTIKMEAYMGLKEYGKAIACLDRLPQGDQHVILSYIKAYKATGDERKELEYLTKRTMYSVDMLERFFTLKKKLDGPASTIKFVDNNFPLTYISYLPCQIELAKACIESNDRKRASDIIDILSKMDMRGHPKELVFEIRKLKMQIGDEATGTTWKTAAQVKKTPAKYKFYFQPLGDANLKALEEASMIVSSFFGARAVILPALPMPQDPDCFRKTNGMYDAPALIERLAVSTELPSDAISMVYVTGENVFLGGVGRVGNYYCSEYGASILAYDCYTYFNRNLPDIIVKETIGLLVSGYSCCTKTSCASTAFYTNDTSAIQLAMCEECQKNYGKLDFDEVHDKLYNKYISLARKNVKRKTDSNMEVQKWIDEYKAKVQAALKKSEADAKGKSGINPEYLPAVEVSNPAPGLSYSYYEFEKNRLRAASRLQYLLPQKTGTIPGFSLESIEQKEYFGIIFSGYVRIPSDDIYTFYLSSYGGILYVDDRETINNDHKGSIVKRTASVALKAGLHPIRLDSVRGKRNDLCNLYWQSSKITAQGIPPELLYQNKEWIDEHVNLAKKAKKEPEPVLMPDKGYRITIAKESDPDAKGRIVLGKDNWKGEKDCSVEALIGMDDRGITVTIDVEDDHLIGDSDVSHENDSVEVYLDLRPSGKRNYNYGRGVIQIIAVPYFSEYMPDTLKFYPQEWNYDPKVDGATAKSSPLPGKGYRMQIFIPYDGLKSNNYTPSDTIMFDLGINDHDGYEGEDPFKQLMWHGTSNNFQSPKDFGKIKVQDCR